MRRMTSTLLLATLLLAPPAVHAGNPVGSEVTAKDAGPAKRPNILFLFGDDWAWPHASCLGTPGIQTPTFDRLVREGVLFRNAQRRGAVVRAVAGRGVDRAMALATGTGREFAWHAVGQVRRVSGYFGAGGVLRRLDGQGVWTGVRCGANGECCRQGLQGFQPVPGRAPKDRPFCFWFGSHYPHRPYRAGSGAKGGIDPAKVVVPPYLPDNEVVRNDIADYYLAAQAFDRAAGEVLAALEKTGELDNTLIVMSGDNGWPFPRCKATCYDTGTHQPLAVRWGARVKPGRVVEDFVSLADLAPTFLEAAGLTPPKEMTACSFLNVLLSEKSGQVDPARNHTLTGMERHADAGRTDGPREGVGYPMRTIITKDFHYLRNFRPQRWPAADPVEPVPGFERVAGNTYATSPDCDAGPSKAWIVTHGHEPLTAPYYERAFGKRPARELYDLRNDPYELKNVAEDPAYAATLRELDDRLMAELKATGDPRVTGNEDAFELLPPPPLKPRQQQGGKPEVKQ